MSRSARSATTAQDILAAALRARRATHRPRHYHRRPHRDDFDMQLVSSPPSPTPSGQAPRADPRLQIADLQAARELTGEAPLLLPTTSTSSTRTFAQLFAPWCDGGPGLLPTLRRTSSTRGGRRLPLQIEVRAAGSRPCRSRPLAPFRPDSPISRVALIPANYRRRGWKQDPSGYLRTRFTPEFARIMPARQPEISCRKRQDAMPLTSTTRLHFGARWSRGRAQRPG